MARDLCPLSCLTILPAVRAAGVALGVILVLLGVGLALGLTLGAVVVVASVLAAWAAVVVMVDGCACGLILPVLLRCCLRPGSFTRGRLWSFWSALVVVWARYLCSRSKASVPSSRRRWITRLRAGAVSVSVPASSPANSSTVTPCV